MNWFFYILKIKIIEKNNEPNLKNNLNDKDEELKKKE